MASNDGQLHSASRKDTGYKHASTLHLLYHELHPSQSAYGYALATDSFRAHLDLFADLEKRPGRTMHPAITFDDGHRSNFEQALPLLLSYGVTARFFITAGWTSTRAEYMTWEQLRTLQHEGQQIGAHGWSHRLLTHCSEGELETELGKTRRVLEDKLGSAITTISLPGGRYDRRVLAACRRTGYTQVFTSVPRAQTSTDAELIGRLNLRAGVTLPWLEAALTPGSSVLRRLQLSYQVKSAAQRTLGDALYMKLWAVLNSAEAGDHPASTL